MRPNLLLATIAICIFSIELTIAQNERDNNGNGNNGGASAGGSGNRNARRELMRMIRRWSADPDRSLAGTTRDPQRNFYGTVTHRNTPHVPALPMPDQLRSMSEEQLRRRARVARIRRVQLRAEIGRYISEIPGGVARIESMRGSSFNGSGRTIAQLDRLASTLNEEARYGQLLRSYHGELARRGRPVPALPQVSPSAITPPYGTPIPSTTTPSSGTTSTTPVRSEAWYRRLGRAIRNIFRRGRGRGRVYEAPIWVDTEAHDISDKNVNVSVSYRSLSQSMVISISGHKADQGDLYLNAFDIAGKRVWQQSVAPIQDEQIIDISMAHLLSGVYLIHVTDGREFMETQKIIHKK